MWYHIDHICNVIKSVLLCVLLCVLKVCCGTETKGEFFNCHYYAILARTCIWLQNIYVARRQNIAT